jgi:hypothetical protein
MNAERLLLTTDEQGRITGLPQFEPNQEIELIVLFSKKPAKSKPVYRIPPVELAGKVKILADIIAPVVEENEWDALHESVVGYSYLAMVGQSG